MARSPLPRRPRPRSRLRSPCDNACCSLVTRFVHWTGLERRPPERLRHPVPVVPPSTHSTPTHSPHAQAKDDRRNNSLLVVAAARGYLHDVETLVAAGASVSAVDKRGVSALHYAAGGDREAVTAYLLSRGADGDVEDKSGATPLHWATSHGAPRAAAALLARGVWAAAPDGRDETPLHIAAR